MHHRDAGKGIANPLSQLPSTAMPLECIGVAADAPRVERAVRGALQEGGARLEQRGRAMEGTEAITDAVVFRV